jgi:hypothetical protein
MTDRIQLEKFSSLFWPTNIEDNRRILLNTCIFLGFCISYFPLRSAFVIPSDLRSLTVPQRWWYLGCFLLFGFRQCQVQKIGRSIQTNDSQSRVPRPMTSTPPGNLLEMLLNQKFHRGKAQESVLLILLGDSGACQRLKTTNLDIQDKDQEKL